MSSPTRVFVEGGCLLGVSSGVWVVRVAYMNMGRGCDATHEFMEGSARKGVGVAFGVSAEWIVRAVWVHSPTLTMCGWGVSQRRTRLPVTSCVPCWMCAIWWRGCIGLFVWRLGV